MQGNWILFKRCQSKNQTPKITQENRRLDFNWIFILHEMRLPSYNFDRQDTNKTTKISKCVYIVNISQEITEDETCR